MSDDDYQFDDIDPNAEVKPATPAPSAPSASPASPARTSGGGGSYAKEIFSKQIRAKFRTFYIDLKESGNGRFIKISEKSHGRKSTIMMDSEDVSAMIEALQEVQAQL